MPPDGDSPAGYRTQIQMVEVPDEFSNREHEVLRLLARGYTNQETAKLPFISVHSTETYCGRIMQKLEFHARAEIVRYALGAGELDNERGGITTVDMAANSRKSHLEFGSGTPRLVPVDRIARTVWRTSDVADGGSAQIGVDST